MSGSQPSVPDSEIQRLACALFDRHGERALAVARDRVTKLSRSPDRPALDVALRVLSAVATILEEAENAEDATKH